MHTIKLDKAIVELYDNIDDMPARRYFNFIYYLSLSMNIDIHNLPTYFTSLNNQIASDEKKEALTQVRNIQISFSNALSKIDIGSFAWAQLLYNVDHKRVADFSDDNLSKIVNDLSDKGLTIGHIHPVIATIKKKWTPNYSSVTS